MNPKNPNARACLECGQPVKGRRDKKFCDDACRNSYNNRENREATNLVRNTNRTLAKNRRILAALNPHGKSKTTVDILRGKGFDFNYFTGMYETQKGGRYFFCYEQGYILLGKNEVALVVKQEYVDRQKL